MPELSVPSRTMLPNPVFLKTFSISSNCIGAFSSVKPIVSELADASNTRLPIAPLLTDWAVVKVVPISNCILVTSKCELSNDIVNFGFDCISAGITKGSISEFVKFSGGIVPSNIKPCVFFLRTSSSGTILWNSKDNLLFLPTPVSSSNKISSPWVPATVEPSSNLKEPISSVSWRIPNNSPPPNGSITKISCFIKSSITK